MALGRLHRVLIRSGVGWASSGDQAAASLPWPRRLAPPSRKPVSHPRTPGPQAVIRQYDPKLPTLPSLPRPWAVRNVEIATGKRRRNQKHRCHPAPESHRPCPASQERASRFSLPETQRVPSTFCLIPCIPSLQTPVPGTSPGPADSRGARLTGSPTRSGSQNAFSGGRTFEWHSVLPFTGTGDRGGRSVC